MRSFRRLLAAQCSANLADGVVIAALPLLVAAFTRDPGAFGVVNAATRLPWLLLPLGAGAMVDRVDRFAVLRRANALRGLVAVAFAGLVLTGRLTESVALVVIAVFAFAVGAAEVLIDSSAAAALPAVVPSERLEAANGHLVGAETVTNAFVGPPLGAFAFALAGAAPFGVAAVAWAVAAGIMGVRGRCRWPHVEVAGAADRQLAVAWRWLRVQHALLGLCGLAAVLAFVDGAGTAVLVLVALERLGLGEAGFGLLLAVGAGGSIAGAAAAPRLVRRLPTGALLAGVVLLVACGRLAMGIGGTPQVVFAAHALHTAAAGVWMVSTVSLRQRLVPSPLLGRVGGFYRTAGMGALPLGALVGGVVARSAGLAAAYLWAVPLLLVAAVAAQRVGGALAERHPAVA